MLDWRQEGEASKQADVPFALGLAVEEVKASVKAGDFIEHNPESFKNWLFAPRSTGMTYRLFITPRAQREI